MREEDPSGAGLSPAAGNMPDQAAQLRQIMENVPAMIAYIDSELHCRFANRAYAEFFGLTPDRIVGMHMRGVAGEALFGAVRERFERVLAGERLSYEVARTDEHGGERQLEISLVPDRGPDGRVRGFIALKQDVTERRHAKRELEHSEEKFSRMFRLGPGAMSISNLAGINLDVNDAFLQMFGFPREEVIGHTCLELGIWPSPEARERWLQACLPAGSVKNYEAEMHTRTGAPRQTMLATEVIEFGGERLLMTSIFDITARKRTEDALRRSEEEVRRLASELESRVHDRTAELRAANRELESFAYSISHDLRAPLRGIDGFSRLLLDDYGDRLDEQGRDYLGRVRRAAQRLGALIDDLLELSRVTRQEMRRETVDLSRLAREILEEMTRSAPERPVSVRVEGGCAVRGDPQLLRVLMENLLDNAWKYTGKTAHPCIEFGRAANSGDAAFFVRDNGAGFDMAYADRLFSPFQRLHKPEEFEGTGIGLASVARVVHRHGGRVWAKSHPGLGATFHFSLGKEGQTGQ